jgi:hypothetical protein
MCLKKDQLVRNDQNDKKQQYDENDYRILYTRVEELYTRRAYHEVCVNGKDEDGREGAGTGRSGGACSTGNHVFRLD